jgi:hypothetical protein
MWLLIAKLECRVLLARSVSVRHFKIQLTAGGVTRLTTCSHSEFVGIPESFEIGGPLREVLHERVRSEDRLGLVSTSLSTFRSSADSSRLPA